MLNIHCINIIYLSFMIFITKKGQKCMYKQKNKAIKVLERDLFRSMREKVRY